VPQADWNPGAYARFRSERLRPALDLLMRIEDPSPGAVVDLGCGDGAVAGAVRARFPKRPLVGVDASPAMLALARGYDATEAADIATWRPRHPPAVIYANAALHWLPDHDRMISRLAAFLAPGGTLTVQMPRQFDAPSHALLRQTARALFPDRFDFRDWTPPVAPPAAYARLLVPLGQAEVWETEYLHRLSPVPEGHPVRAFTGSTATRSFLDRLDAAEAAAFAAAYDSDLVRAYPAEPDGTVLFPFRRLFFTLALPR